MEPIILVSARRHGVADEDMLQAFRNPLRVVEQDDDMTVIIGPARNGRLLEVGVVVAVDFDGVLIAHSMKARGKHWR